MAKGNHLINGILLINYLICSTFTGKIARLQANVSVSY